jgi:hypothetical protein
MPLQDLKKQVLELSTSDRWALLKLLIESLQPSVTTLAATTLPTTPAVLDEHPLAQYYGCIDDETFIRHPQPGQPEREAIL